jgi:NitT/TauT family transport system substrate-binding protein
MTSKGVITAVAIAFFAVPCGLGGSADADTLSISQYGRVNADLPWAIAMKKGLFKAEGLNIDQVLAGEGGGTVLRNMLAGDLPYGVVATSTALAGIRSGIDLKIVSTVSDNIGEIALVAMAGSKIRTMKDLVGKKIGFTAPKSTTDWMTHMVLEKNGLADKAELIPTGGFGPGLTLLAQGGVDAAPLNDPLLTQEASKYQVIFPFADQIQRVTWLVGVTTTKFAASNPDKLRAILRAYRKAVDFLYANRAEATAIYADVWGLSLDDANRLLPKYFDMPGEWTHGEFNKAGLDTMSEAEILIGNAAKPIDWNSVVDQRFLAEDLRRPL